MMMMIIVIIIIIIIICLETLPQPYHPKTEWE